MSNELKRLFRIPMQFFAEVSENSPEPTGDNGGGDPNSSEPAKLFTQDDLDRIVNERLARQAKKLYTKEELEKAREDGKTEAEKLAKMNAEQKENYQREQYEKALAERESALTKRELTASAKEMLNEKGLPASLIELVDVTSAERCTATIDNLEKCFNAAVQETVNKKIKSNVPKVGTANTGEKPVNNLADALRAAYRKDE